MTKKWHYVMTYHDLTGLPDWEVPQCECGALARKHYDLATSKDVESGESYGATVICRKCFHAMIKIWWKKEQLKPQWYWDDRDLERAIPADEVGDFDDVGDIIEVRPIVELPKVYVLITENGREFFATEEEAESAKATRAAGGGE